MKIHDNPVAIVQAALSWDGVRHATAAFSSLPPRRARPAEPLRREALETMRKRYGEGLPPVAGALSVLGQNLLRQKKHGEAEPVLRECLKIRETKLPDDWSTFDTRSMLGCSLLGQSRVFH